jgi:N utilization substance protein B
VKTARRQARELALQALYAWQLSGSDPMEQALSHEEGGKTDLLFVEKILVGVVAGEAELQKLITPHLDRDFKRLSPVERAILYIGAFELASQPETPFKVVLNEAIELGKSYGAAEGHRFINGVLEKIAVALRPEEVARARNIA